MIPYNYVLIEPEPNNLFWNGLTLENIVDNRNVYGRVVEVPRRLRGGAKRGSKSVRQKELYQRRNASSLDWKTKIEVQPGDRIMFMHHSRLEKIEDGRMLIPYDQILCKRGKSGVQPINGYVFMEVDEIVQGEKRTVTTGEGKVWAVSNFRNKDYVWSRMEDTFDPKVGQKAYFNPKQGYPIEMEMHRELPRLVAIKRKDIRLIWN